MSLLDWTVLAGLSSTGGVMYWFGIVRPLLRRA